jgi:Tfp pilus assembly protein PilZ
MLTNLKKVANTVEMRPQERRDSIRYPFTAAADVIDLDSNTRLSARSADLARGGCFIDTTNPFPIGTRVTVRLTMEQKTFQAQARVVYSLPGMGMGLAFTAAEPDQIWILKRWLGELSGEMPAELNAPPPPAAPVAPSHQEVKAPSSGDAEAGFVLTELIVTLMRKRILSESEGKLLLQKLVS